MYEKEVTQTENRIEKMKTDGKDEYDIRKMVGFIFDALLYTLKFKTTNFRLN